MPSGYDAEVAELFRDLRAATALSEMELAARIGTRPEVVQALEQGALYALPPWAETCRVVNAYGALLNLDVRPLLRRIYAQLEAGIVELQPKPMPDLPDMTPRGSGDFASSRQYRCVANPLDIPWPPPSQQPPQRRKPGRTGAGAPASGAAPQCRPQPPNSGMHGRRAKAGNPRTAFPGPRPPQALRPTAPGQRPAAPQALRPAGAAAPRGPGPSAPASTSTSSQPRQPAPSDSARFKSAFGPAAAPADAEPVTKRRRPPIEMGDRRPHCLGRGVRTMVALYVFAPGSTGLQSSRDRHARSRRSAQPKPTLPIRSRPQPRSVLERGKADRCRHRLLCRLNVMTTIPADKLDKLVARWQAVQGTLATGADQESYVRFSREFAELDPIVATITAAEACDKRARGPARARRRSGL